MALIAHLQALPAQLGLPTRLRDVGVSEDDLEILAKEASLQTRLLGNNPRELTVDDIHAIYQQVF
ncbi:Iron-containing alcohol dehydrogenase [compost metagenome]